MTRAARPNIGPIAVDHVDEDAPERRRCVARGAALGRAARSRASPQPAKPAARATAQAGSVPRAILPSAFPRRAIRTNLPTDAKQFERLWPGETGAPKAPATAGFLRTCRSLIEVIGQSVRLAEGRREPCVPVSSEGNKFNSFVRFSVERAIGAGIRILGELRGMTR